ncbi:hypothetical protein LXL04_007483 [Taraxacum kok-saghyz]
MKGRGSEAEAPTRRNWWPTREEVPVSKGERRTSPRIKPPAPTGPPSDHHRTTVGPPPDHCRTTTGPPSVTTIGPVGPPPDHCRTTAGPPPDHCRTTAGAPPDDAEDTGADEDDDADKGDTDTDKGDVNADDCLITCDYLVITLLDLRPPDHHLHPPDHHLHPPPDHRRTTAGPPSVHHLHPSAHWTTDAPPPDHRRTTAGPPQSEIRITLIYDADAEVDEEMLTLMKKAARTLNRKPGEELENERERWMEMESEWICLTDELRVDLEANRRGSENVEMELRLEKKCSEELDDALMRSILGHGKMVEHYADLQEIPTVAPVEVRRSRSDGRDGQRTTGYRDGEEGGRDVEGFLEVVGTLFITHR